MDRDDSILIEFCVNPENNSQITSEILHDNYNALVVRTPLYHVVASAAS
jgi:hypothetical protein